MVHAEPSEEDLKLVRLAAFKEVALVVLQGGWINHYKSVSVIEILLSKIKDRHQPIIVELVPQRNGSKWSQHNGNMESFGNIHEHQMNN